MDPAACVLFKGVCDKPNSVPEGGDHFSGPAVADGLKQPTRDERVATR